MQLPRKRTQLLMLLPAPPMIVFVVNLIYRERGEIEPASWLNTSIVGLGVFVVLAFWSLFHMKKQFKRIAGTKLRNKGIDPDGYLNLYGLALFLFPSCIALFLFFAGLPFLHVKIAAIFSILGMIWWSWWFRPNKDSNQNNLAD